MLSRVVILRSCTLLQRGIGTSSRLCIPIQVKMPSLSPTMTEGTIVQWNKKPGEKVAAGDVLCEVQTDKAVVAMESEEEGTLAKILKSQDSGNITVGELIAVMAEGEEDWKTLEVPAEWLKASKEKAATAGAGAEEKPKEQKAESGSEKTAVSQPDGKLSDSYGQDGHYGPSVRLLLHKYGLQAEKVKASGPHGMLLKEDIQRHISSAGAQPQQGGDQAAPARPAAAPQARFIDIELSNMRKTIAKRLTASKNSIPHAYHSMKCELAAVEQARDILRASHGLKLSLNDYVIKACAVALRLVPGANASYDAARGEPVSNSMVDISVAVATPAGLITPIVKQADQLSLVQINAEVKRLADRAKANKLQPNEFQGGTFTVSNLGMFGVREFTAIINPPQSCILAVGGTERVAARHPTTGRIVGQDFMTVTMSSDARCVDQNTAGQFLLVLKDILASPDRYGLHEGLPPTLLGAGDADPLVGDSVGLGHRL